jgi:hypothetical protein
MYGPVAMAVNVTQDYPSDIVEESKLSSNFISLAMEPLNFKVRNHPDLKLRPYYQFAQDEPYVLYVDTAVRNYVLTKNMVFKGNWQKGRGPYFSEEKNASVGTTFNGTGIRISVSGYRNSGIMKVEIDGKQADLFDTYSDKGNEFSTEKVYGGLSSGEHHILVSVTGEKNPDAKNHIINISRFEVIK